MQPTTLLEMVCPSYSQLSYFQASYLSVPAFFWYHCRHNCSTFMFTIALCAFAILCLSVLVVSLVVNNSTLTLANTYDLHLNATVYFLVTKANPGFIFYSCYTIKMVFPPCLKVQGIFYFVKMELCILN